MVEHVVIIVHAVTGEHLAALTMPATATIQHVKQSIQDENGTNRYLQKLVVPGGQIVSGDDTPLRHFPNPVTFIFLKLPHSNNPETNNCLISAARDGSVEQTLNVLKMMICLHFRKKESHVHHTYVSETT